MRPPTDTETRINGYHNSIAYGRRVRATPAEQAAAAAFVRRRLPADEVDEVLNMLDIHEAGKEATP